MVFSRNWSSYGAPSWRHFACSCEIYSECWCHFPLLPAFLFWAQEGRAPSLPMQKLLHYLYCTHGGITHAPSSWASNLKKHRHTTYYVYQTAPVAPNGKDSISKKNSSQLMFTGFSKCISVKGQKTKYS